MNFVKRISICFMAFAVIASFGLKNPVDASYKVSFEVFSDTAFLLNTDTGTVVYEKNPDKKTYPASLTKIMTAIIAIEHVSDLENTVVTAPGYIFDEFYGISVSNAGIERGEEVRMIDLLYALMLPSACEAGSIIADYVGKGNIASFVDMMNAKCAEIGATNTNFENAHGLYHPEQVTTARDMATITQYALKLPIFEKVSTTVSYTMPATNKHTAPRDIKHTNFMLNQKLGGKYYYADMKGVKTGSIDEVGKNLVSTVSRNGYNYLLVTIGAPFNDKNGIRWPAGVNKSFDDAKALYDWALSSFSRQKVLKENDVIDEVPVSLASDRDYVTLVAEQDVAALLPNDVETTAIQKKRILAEDVVAPVKKGTVLGRMELRLADEVIATVNLVASTDVERNNMLYYLKLAGEFFSKPQVIVLLAILALLVCLYAAFSMRYKKLKRRRNNRMRSHMM